MTALAVVAIPVLAGPLLWLAGRRQRGPLLGALGGAVLIATTAVAVAAAVGAAHVQWPWGVGLELSLSADGVAGVVAVLVPAVAAAVVVYAGVHEQDRDVPRLVGLLVAFAGVMELLVLANDLLTLLLAWELVGALSWTLIGFHGDDLRNVQLAGHAFIATRIGELGLFVAAGATYAGTGSVAYTDVAAASGPLLQITAAGILLAAAAKSAQLPFSPWLFSAMAGPTPVSALLHSATMVAAGAYALIRLAPSFEAVAWFGPAVMVVGLATALAGGFLAVIQTHGKRVLAASTSAQYGLMFTAIGAGAAGAAALHLVVHAVFKALLFLGIGVAMHAADTADIRKMRLGRALPRPAVAFAVGAAALAAIPPFGGAWTKEEIVAAAGTAGAVPFVLALVAGLLSAVYATRLHLFAFGRGGAATVHSPHRTEVAVLGALAAVSIAFSALWVPAVAHAAEAVVGLPVAEGSVGATVASLAAVVAGVAVAAVLVRRRVGTPVSDTIAPDSILGDWYGLPLLSARVVVAPVLAFARALAAFDARVVDGGVRAAAAVGTAASRALAWWAERGVDGVVRLLAGSTVRTATLSRFADDRGVDAAVEGVAAGIGRAGARARLLQSGLAHQYYVIVAVGFVAIVATIALGR